MNKLFKNVLIGLSLIVAALSCTDDRVVQNGMTFGEARTIWNQNFADLYDSVKHHTELIATQLNYDYLVDTNTAQRADIHTLFTTTATHTSQLTALELIDHTHSNSAILNGTTASFTTSKDNLITSINGTVSNHTSSLSILNDTVVSHNIRLKTLESAIIGASYNNITLTGTTTVNSAMDFANYDRPGADTLGIWLVNGVIDTVPVLDYPAAEWGRTDKLDCFLDMMIDWKKNKELNWKYKNTKGEFVNSGTLDAGPMGFEQDKVNQQIQAQIEHNYRYDFRLRLLFFALLLWTLYQRGQIRDLKKRSKTIIVIR